eukprot:TRINITY_DN4369_c0_g1_i2.p1 TRINITY_DN4369_c0_g1~~TRINITY_DN4369_c0_g1_i2.p1  ORF type:complete len:133 (-),score=39.42 TRINITY_DN4369_c0_g1_i2:409-807(-)
MHFKPEEKLNWSNFDEMFEEKKVWVVDDSNLHRVTLHRSSVGHFKSTPINGVIFLLEPSNGDLFMRIVHSSEFGRSRNKQGKDGNISAKSVSCVLESLPLELHPEMFILNGAEESKEFGQEFGHKTGSCLAS